MKKSKQQPLDAESIQRENAALLAQWDHGETIWTCEMGGLGPGYEQAIQILAIEILRDNYRDPLPTQQNYRDWGYATVERIDRKQPDGSYSCGGFSGAQVGAAKGLAFCWIRDGYTKTTANIPTDRKIQASKFFPKAPASRRHRSRR